PADAGARIGEQPPQDRDRPRRRGDERPRVRPEPQAELKHVPGGLGPAPPGELVAPGGPELRSAQAVGLLRREGLGESPVRPLDPAAGGRPVRAPAPAAQAEQPRGAFDHHVAHVGEGLAHQRDPADGRGREGRIAERQGAHPFGSRAG
ncbi:hypothetical protein QU38_01690, partial [Staphylococcus aureus]